MKRFSKVALGAIAVAVGAGSAGCISIFRSQALNVKGEDATVTATYAYADSPKKFGDFTFSDFDDKSSYYLLPSEGKSCLVYKAGVLGASGLSVDKTKQVVITINHATYLTGTNPSSDTFSFYNNTDGTGTAISATAGGTFASSSSFVDAVYTFSADVFSGDDFCIKVTKPGKQIRFKSFSIQYTKAEVKTATSLAVTGTLAKTSYYAGDVFDPTGLTVTATYEDATTASVTSSVVWSNPAVGQNYVTGTYTSGATVTCQSPTISVTALLLSSISVTATPTKTTYVVGEAFDKTGIAITGTYNSGATKNVTADCTCSVADGAALNTIGTQTITVSDGDCTTSFEITVNPKVMLDVTSLTLSEEGVSKTITATGVFSGTPTYEVFASTSDIVTTEVNSNIIMVTPITGGTTTLTIRGTYLTEVAEATCTVKCALLTSSATLTAASLGVGNSYSNNTDGTVDSVSNYKFAWTNLLKSSGNVQFKNSTGSLYNVTGWKAPISRITITQSAGNAGVFALYPGESSNPTSNPVTPSISGSEYTYDLSASTYHYFTIKSTTGYFVLSSVVVETTADEVKAFISSFNAALSITCSNTEPTAISATTWTDQTTVFNRMSTSAKALVKAINTQTEADATKQLAMSRYDYVMGKAAYSSFADFIGRFPSRTPSSAATSLNADKANPMIPLAVLMAGAGATGLIFLAKKKKHD